MPLFNYQPNGNHHDELIFYSDMQITPFVDSLLCLAGHLVEIHRPTVLDKVIGIIQ